MGTELINIEVSHPLVLGLQHLKQRGNNTVGFYQMGHTRRIGPIPIKPLAGRETKTTIRPGASQHNKAYTYTQVSKDANSTEVSLATDCKE